MQSKTKTRNTKLAADKPGAIRLEFLGWSRPILHAACDYLLEHYSNAKEWNLDRMLLVLPGSLAGRTLQRLLAHRADRERIVLRPPEVLTLGKLPEQLYQAKRPFASELDQIMAWTQVLRAMPPAELRPLLFEVPQTDELTPWMELGRILGSLHRELASDLLDFSDVAHKMAGTIEEPRWHVLAALQRRYLDVLDEAGLWDVQTARRIALELGEVQATDHKIVLIGTVDLNRAQRQFLSAIASQVTALVGAPQSFGAGFAPDGTLRSEFWQQLEIPIDDKVLHVRSTVRDAAEELAVQLALLGSSRAASEITVGVPDATLIPAFQESLQRAGVAMRYGPGESIHASQPMKLMACIQAYLADGEIDSLHDVLRETVIDGWLRNRLELEDDYLAKIDEYLKDTLLRSVRVPVFPEGKSGKVLFERVLSALQTLFEPLHSGKRTLSQWVEPIRAVLRSLYAGFSIDQQSSEGHAIWRACAEINQALEQWVYTPANLNAEIELGEAFSWLNQMLEGVQIPPQRDAGAIEMIGWLELALDDAPVLMLSGMHDGVIPESVNSDAFLPNQLRSQLGLIDNARRYARDAYVMMTILNTREQVEFIINRMNSDGDPQTPSRLLLSVPAERLARRVLKLISDTEVAQAKVIAWTPRVGQSDIPIPLPKKDVAISDMAVTDFKKYDECPYRFYLSRVLKLKAVEHLPLELDGSAFGDLIHHVLEDFYESPVAKAAEAKPIEDWLVRRLREESEKRFGVSPPPAVVVQIEQAELRLKHFSSLQAQKMRDGWEMIEAEFKVERSDAIDLQLDEKRTMKLHGRIDRIDKNEHLKRWAVWDYKTGDRSGDPREKHLKSKTWVDWQLPLYGVLIKEKMKIPTEQVTFGYVLLPKNVAETKFVSADFSSDEIAAALESAKGLARQVMDGVFWPPKYSSVNDHDDYGAITQRSVVRRWDPRGVSQASAPPPCEQAPANQPRPRRLASQPSVLEVTPVAAEGQPPREWFEPQMIRASAGTGKTYRLASRAIQLLFSDQPLETVLATTFTRKAAGEILHRILSWLAKACESDADFLKLEEVLSPLRITRPAVRYQLARLCAQLHRFRVSTLDSFYSQLARSFALELELPPGWSMLDPSQEEQLRRDAVTRMFEHVQGTKLRSLISQMDKGDAVRSIRNQIDAVVDNGYAMYLQAPKKELWETLQISPGPSDEDLRLAIAHIRKTSLGTPSVNERRDVVLRKFDEQDWEGFLKETLVINSHDRAPAYKGKPIASDAALAIRVLAKHASVAFLSSRNNQNLAAFELLELFDKYLKQIKQQRRVFTFADIATRIAWWLNRSSKGKDEADAVHPSLESISHRLDCSIDHLLLDEFQDTSPEQWEILKPFVLAIREVLNDRPQSASFFVVGDTKQAIYAWRGGVSEVFESVGQEIANIRSEDLTSSHRSSPVIIGFVNDTFQRLALHPKFLGDDSSGKSDSPNPVVEAWIQRYFKTHSTVKESLPGYVEIGNAPLANETDDATSDENPVFNTIAERVALLHAEAPQVTIGILTRTNHDVAELITLLRDRGVEASQEGGNPLTDTAPALVIQSALHLADHPGDTTAHFHVAQSPLATYWAQEVRDSSHRMSQALRRELHLKGLGATVSSLVDHLAPACNARDQERLKQLVEEAYRFMSFRNHHLHAFIEFLGAHRVGLPSESRVRVMTIHQAKGLEFDAVFLPSLEHNIVARVPSYLVMRATPTSPPIGIIRYVSKQLQPYLDTAWQIALQESAEQQLGDALCLFYVALTRARHALYLVTSAQKNPVKTWSSVLHTLYGDAATSGQAGALLYRQGDPAWHQQIGPSRARPAETGVSRAEPAADGTAGAAMDVADRNAERSTCYRVTLAHRPSTDSEKTIAPSALKENSQEPHGLADLWQRESNLGAVLGKLVHRWMEEIRDWVEDGVPSAARLAEIANSSMTQDELSQIHVDEWVERFRAYVSSAEVRGALSHSRYESWHQPHPLRLVVSRERRLLQRVDNQLVRGAIDRCVLGYDGEQAVRAEVLDFKIDQCPDPDRIEAWVRERIRVHTPQLQLYGTILRQQYGLRPDQLALTLVLLSAGRVVSIPVVAADSPNDAST